VPEIVFHSAARLLVVLHAVAAIVLIGATTHHALIALGYVRGRAKVRLGRIYATTSAVAYAVTFGIGLWAYPTFRYHVRTLFLDRFEPWASNLFEAKENVAALGLPLVVMMLVISRSFDVKEDRLLVRMYAACALLVAAIVWFDVLTGIVITMTKGV
jgi:hypothetical protein